MMTDRDREALFARCLLALDTYLGALALSEDVVKKLHILASAPTEDSKADFPMEGNPQLLGELCQPRKAVTEEELFRKADDVAARIWTDILGARGEYAGWWEDKCRARGLIVEALRVLGGWK